MAAQHITYGSTESLIGYYSPKPEPPSSATVAVYAPGVSDVSVEAATVDSVSTTLSAAAAAGATTLTVASATGITAGRSYLVATPGGYVPVPVSKVSGSTVYLDEPAPCALANSSAFVGWAVTHALTTSETATKGEGHALWSFTIGGVVYPWRQSFYVTTTKDAYTLNWPKLTALFPIAARLRPGDDVEGDETISAGWTDLRFYLDVRGLRPERIKSPDILEYPHALACVWHLVAQTEDLPEEVKGDWRDRYFLARSSVVENSREFWYDESDVETTRGDDARRNVAGSRLVR